MGTPKLALGLLCAVCFAGSFAEVSSGNSPEPAPDPIEEAGRHIPPGIALKYVHYSNPMVTVGDPAPAIVLPVAAGGDPWTLAKHRGRPVALVFGSLTGTRLRAQAKELERLRAEFEGRAEFVLIYIREAHALDEWVTDANEAEGIQLLQPATDAARRDAAREFVERLAPRIPVAVDGLDDAVMKAYGAWPERLFLVNAEGRIAYRGRPGPAGFRPDELRAALGALLPAAPQAGP